MFQKILIAALEPIADKVTSRGRVFWELKPEYGSRYENN